MHQHCVEARPWLHLQPQLRKATAKQLPQLQHPPGDRRQTSRTVMHRVEAGHHREQHLGGADVAGGLVAADVLLAGLQSQAQGLAPLRIERLPHQPARDPALMGGGGGEEGGMGAAEPERDAEALTTANGNLHAQLAHWRQQHLGQGIHGGRHHHSSGAGGGDQLSRIPERTAGSRQLHQQTKRPSEGLRTAGLLRQERTRLHLEQLDTQGFSAGLQHRPGLRQHLGIHQEAVGTGIAASAVAEAHRLGRSGGLIEQRGIGDRQRGELADQGLEIEQRLEAPLADLSLIRGVGGVPGRVFKHVALQQRRGDAVAVAQADQAAAHLVSSSDLLQFRQGFGLAAAHRQPLCSGQGLETNRVGHHLGDQLLQVVQAEIAEHLGLLGRIRANVTGDKGAQGRRAELSGHPPWRCRWRHPSDRPAGQDHWAAPAATNLRHRDRFATPRG